MQLVPGALVGKYRLIEQLGEGGFGVVFVASDQDLEREVAIKFLLPEHVHNQQILQRFLQEARAAARIPHPGIVTVFDCGQLEAIGEHGGTAFIAMELLRGETLAHRLRRGRIAVEQALEIARQIASALEAAHRAGIVHRDLKPDNVFLVPDPAAPWGERIKILDFGIAKLADVDTSSVKTHSMMVFGTPRYMSPEQCRSAAKIDHRSDVYALGCIVFEMLCGTTPYHGDPGELIAKHQLSPVPNPRSVDPSVPADLDRVVTAMLAKAPDDRPRSMAMVEAAFTPGGDLQAAVPTPSPRAEPGSEGRRADTTLSAASGTGDGWRRGRRRWIAAGVVGLGIAAAGTLLATQPTDRDRGSTRVAPSVPREVVPAVAAPSPPTAPARAPQPAIPAPAVPTLDAGAEVAPSEAGGSAPERSAVTRGGAASRHRARSAKPDDAPASPTPVIDMSPAVSAPPAPPPTPVEAPPAPARTRCAPNDPTCIYGGGK